MKKILLTGMALGLVAMQSIASDVSSKSGFIVGVDLGFGLGKGSSTTTDMPAGAPNPPAGGAGSVAFFDINSLATTGKLVVGYQKYSERLSFMGFNIKAKAGSGFGMINQVMTEDVGQNNQSLPINGQAVTTTYMPLSIGVEANFLLDFVERGEHVFGGSVGVGYEFATGAGRKNVFRSVASNTYAPLFSVSPLSYQLVSPKIGLHYYYGHHQFGMDVSFDKVLDKIRVALDASSGAGNNNSEQTLITDLNRFCTVSLSYAYRF